MAGWQKRPVADVCTMVTDGSHFSPATTAAGYPYITVRDVKEGRIDFENCAFVNEDSFNELRRNGCAPLVGDILFSKDGTVGKVALVTSPREFVVLSSLAILRPNVSLIDPAFMSYVLMSPDFLNAALGQKTGVAIRRIILKNLKQILVPFPALAEQRRIVAILDEAFEGIAIAKANAEKNLQNARKILDDYLDSVFSEPAEGWSASPVGAIADCCLGKMLDKAKNKGEPKPYLRNLNVRWFQFDLNDVREMRFTADEYERYSVRRGDVVICEGGYPGRAAIWEEDAPMFFQKALHRVRFKDAIVGRWFLYYLYSQEVSGKLRQHFTGTGIQHFTGTALSRLVVPLAPRATTETLVERFDAMAETTNRLTDIYRRKVVALEELKDSLLHQALTGAITVESAHRQIGEVA